MPNISRTTKRRLHSLGISLGHRTRLNERTEVKDGALLAVDLRSKSTRSVTVKAELARVLTAERNSSKLLMTVTPIVRGVEEKLRAVCDAVQAGSAFIFEYEPR